MLWIWEGFFLSFSLFFTSEPPTNTSGISSHLAKYSPLYILSIVLFGTGGVNEATTTGSSSWCFLCVWLLVRITAGSQNRLSKLTGFSCKCYGYNGWCWGHIPPAPPLPVVLVAAIDTTPPSPGPWFLGIMTAFDVDTAGIGGWSTILSSSIICCSCIIVESAG